MLIVVNLHCLRVDVRFERVERVRQRRQFVRPRARCRLGRGRAGCDYSRAGQNRGMKSFPTCHHNHSFFRTRVNLAACSPYFNCELRQGFRTVGAERRPYP